MTTIGFAMCGSYCTFEAVFKQIEILKNSGYNIIPIMSENSYTLNTRFGDASHWREKMRDITENRIIHTIPAAEPIGPKKLLDALVIAPCTGNTLAKLATGVTDTCVTLAAKAHLRQDRPLLIALASNDAMSQNLSNIGTILTRTSVYFLPMRQDDPKGKPHSLVADFSRLPDALAAMRRGEQLRPLFLSTK